MGKNFHTGFKYARLDEVDDEVREQIGNWVLNLRPNGLWICGTRRSGTTYTAKVAMNALRAGRDDIWGGRSMTALSMTEMRRAQWSMQSTSAANPGDYDLFNELRELEASFGELWEPNGALWIDDLHSGSVDMGFFRKHVWPYIEARVKEPLCPTVISTSLPPDHPELTGLEKVITDLFTVVVL